MKSKVKEVYYCDYCKKHGLHKGKMAYHEKICRKNPENDRPCWSCYYLTSKEMGVCLKDYRGIEYEKTVELFYCQKMDCFLYTPQNQIKGNQFDLGEYVNNPMPKNCEFKLIN